MKYTKILVFCLLLFINFFKVNASENINNIKNLLEGRYELIFWKQDNLKFEYPKVAGTLVVSHNKISFTLDSNMTEGKTIKIIGWGHYTLTTKKYNYGYFDFKKMTDDGRDLQINKNLPWKGMREYSVSIKGDKLLLNSKTGKQTWTLDKDSLIYTDKEWGEDKKEVIRYWKRIDK